MKDKREESEKREKISEALDNISSRHVEEAADFAPTKMPLSRKKIILRCIAVAACVAVVVGVIFAIPMFKNDEKAPFEPIVNQQIKADGPVGYGDSTAHYSPSSVSAERRGDGVSVTAEFLEALPDTYVFYDDLRRTEFRLIRMRTVKRLNTQEMPDEFYYIIPIEYMADFSIYDKILIHYMGYFGYEHSVIYNKTQDCAERSELAIFGYRPYTFATLSTNFIPFDSKGKLDESLWDSNEMWIKSTKYRDGPKNLKAAEFSFSSSDSDLHVCSVKDLTGEAAEAFKEVTSFENGLYVLDCTNSKQYYSRVHVSARRYINGFATNEKISILGEYEYYGEHYDGDVNRDIAFNEEDMKALPDLAYATDQINQKCLAGEITPPHIKDHQNFTKGQYGIFSWYAKTDEGVCGVVKVSMWYKDERNQLLYDDAYYIIEFGSEEITPIDRDDLLDLPGSNFVYSGEYDERGKVPSNILMW